MSATWGPPGAEAAVPLRRLLHKYELLCALSRGVPGRTLARRDALRELAELYPAALREWDALPASELDRRRQLVAARLSAVEAGEQLAGSPGEDWLRYALDLHDCLRAMLKVRRFMIKVAGRTRRDTPFEHPVWQSSAVQAACVDLLQDCAVAWLALTPELLAEVALPSGGRLAALAYQAVAARHGVSAEAIKAALFGRPFLTPAAS